MQLKMLVGAVSQEDVVRSWALLLQACEQQAPALLASWNAGSGALLRLAAAVPRDEWLRSPLDPWVGDHIYIYIYIYINRLI